MSEEIDMVLLEAEEKMENAVAHSRAEFATVRTGRASPVLVEKLGVEYYGAETTMQQLASFSVPEARQLVISPFDKSSIGAIERAIQEADLGLNPSSDGVVIRLNFPMLTEERRKELVRMVKAMAEEGKIQIRGIRRSARHELDALERDGDASADDIQRAAKGLDRLTHDYEQQVSDALTQKEDELLEV
ncbi:MAG: ribosome recycling factor [Acidimicrobiia bacterium]|nr:ribosome recycling factor [Acidimicrobiia bacterium]